MSKNKPGAIVKMAADAGMDAYDFVAAAVAEHGSAKAAARALGVSLPAIYYYAVTPIEKVSIDKIKVALEEHGNVKAAALALGITPHVIYDRLHRAGLKVRNRVELVSLR